MPRARTTKRTATKAVAQKAIDANALVELFLDCCSNERGSFGEGSSLMSIDASGDITITDEEYREEYFVSIKDAYKHLQSQQDAVQIGDYKAKVTSGGIEVGCQEISFDEFDNLAEVVAKVRGK